MLKTRRRKFNTFFSKKKIKVLTTSTKASPTFCKGSQESKRRLNSSKNLWCKLKIAGTLKNISSTVCASIMPAYSGDFRGFKYF